MTIDRTLVPRRNERIAARVIDGKAVIVVLDAHQLHTLNEVGTRVFDLCDGVRDVQAIADAIVREFEVDQTVALQDVEQFVLELSRTGAIAVEDAA